MTKPFDAIIALGSNIGDKIGHVGSACALLEGHDAIELVARSKLYRTEPWGEEDQDWFVNACVSVTTSLSPLALLKVCQGIENELGRVREKRWGPRVIDLDLLVYKDISQDDPELTLPHPLITERAFVLVPLKDIGPRLSIKGKTVAQWLASMNDHGVVALAPFNVDHGKSAKD